MKNTFLATFALLLAVFLPTTASAATFQVGELYSLNGSEIVDDNLYVGAGDLTVGGTVLGDLFAGGGAVVLSGTIRDDLAAAGGDISLLGAVGGDARIAGGNILIGSPIGGDLIVMGGSIKTLDTVTVGKDMNLVGGYIVFNGELTGDALLAGGEVVINGIMHGDVLVEVGERLTLGENAQIDGMLVYKASSENMLEENEGAVVTGGILFEQTKAAPYNKKDVAGGIAALFGALLLLKLVAVMLSALVLVLIFKRFSQSMVSTALNSFWTNVLHGFVVLVVVPIAAILLLITVFGFHLGLLLLAFYTLVLMIGGIYAGVILGYWLVKKMRKDEVVTLVWWHALVGVLALSLLKLVPVLGWIVGCILLFAAVGTLYRLFKEGVWTRR